jgi:hypothetical protein
VTRGPRSPPGPLGSCAVRGTLTAGVALLLAGCTPLYVPLIPRDMLAPEPAFRLHGDARLELVARGDGPRLVMTIRAEEVPHAGWLAVQWFGPSGPARASESLWFDAGEVDEERTLETPADLALTPGEWRAVLSWQDRLVRQLLATVP